MSACQALAIVDTLGVVGSIVGTASHISILSTEAPNICMCCAICAFRTGTYNLKLLQYPSGTIKFVTQRINSTVYICVAKYIMILSVFTLLLSFIVALFGVP